MQYWTVEPLGGTLLDPLADLANPFADLASFFFFLVVTGFSTTEDVLPYRVDLLSVCPCVGSEIWFAWCSRSITHSIPLLLFLIRQMVFFHTNATIVRSISATVAASFF